MHILIFATSSFSSVAVACCVNCSICSSLMAFLLKICTRSAITWDCCSSATNIAPSFTLRLLATNTVLHSISSTCAKDGTSPCWPVSMPPPCSPISADFLGFVHVLWTYLGNPITLPERFVLSPSETACPWGPWGQQHCRGHEWRQPSRRPRRGLVLLSY